MPDEKPDLEAVAKTVETERAIVIKTCAIQAVDNQTDLTFALAKKIELKSFTSRVTEKFEPLRKAAHDAYKRVLAMRDELLAPAEAEIERIDQLTSTYLQAEEERRLEEQRKAQEAANEAARKAQAEEAARLKAEGQRKAAKAVLAAPVVVQPVEPAPAPVLPKGVSVAKRWDFEITEPLALPREWLQPDEQKIRRQVNATGPETKIRGVRVFQVISTPTRTGR